jgi:hypothetical protein
MDVMRKQRIGLCTILITSLAAVGCQSGPSSTPVRYDNVRFMDVWTTYTHCLSSREVRSAMPDSIKLQEVSQTQTNKSPQETFLPNQFKNIVAQPSSRLAVDVHAMAASCSLHTGTLALSVGEHDLARNQFRQILDNPTQADYPYYAAQARAQLSHLELALQAAL